MPRRRILSSRPKEQSDEVEGSVEGLGGRQIRNSKSEIRNTSGEGGWELRIDLVPARPPHRDKTSSPPNLLTS